MSSYLLTPEAVQIIRILHGSRDIENIFQDEF